MVISAIRRIGGIWAGIRNRRQRPFVQNAATFGAEKPADSKINKREFFTFIARGGRRSVPDVNKELARLGLGVGKITFDEYVRYRFYDPDGPSAEEKQRFLSEGLHWGLVSKVSNPTYDALTQDKFVSYRLLASFGFPVPITLAVITTGIRTFPGVDLLRTPDDLHRFVASRHRGTFIKANTGIGSIAAFICDGVDGDALLTRPHGRKTADEMMAIVNGRDFLVQEIIANHSGIEPVTTAASTIRMTNFLIDGRVHTPIAIIKLTTEDAIADNFWRAGNMLADIDMASGRIRRAVRGHGMEMELLKTAPKSGQPLIGFQIPFWREIVELNEKCALALAPIPFTSLDIAVTDTGPVIVEVNTGGSFDLPQLASGKGLLTPQVRAFFGL